MTLFYSSLFFVLGAAVGSFLNVCISRIPNGESIISPGSHCPKCGCSIKPYDNIPILSYILLGGRCRSCRQAIDFRYWAVEMLTAFLFLIFYWRLGFSYTLPLALLFTAVMIAVGFIDLGSKIIPNVITIPGIAVALGFSALQGASSFRDSILGILLGGGGLLVVGSLGNIIFDKESMGGGDIKLAAMIGAFWGWKIALATFLLSFLSGGIGGIVLLFTRKTVKMQSAIPFGPFIAASAIIALFYGRDVVDIYLTYLRG
ncbi:MAG: prepilin peptidase [Candidatus Latescibacteria bacterium]|nr:prepilin peptidase [Candidatus Latescibacterota bacterium]